MNKNDAILAHDLMIMEEMAANMAAYLDSDIVDWTIPRANMPRLTIGGYLMRQRRLSIMKERLDEEDRERLRPDFATQPRIAGMGDLSSARL